MTERHDKIQKSYNDIGIDSKLDRGRIRKLMLIGIFAACMVLVGDMLLGWGMHDASKGGMEGYLSAYINLPDGRIFWSTFLGLLGIPLEALSYFGVYRLIAPCSGGAPKIQGAAGHHRHSRYGGA